MHLNMQVKFLGQRIEFSGISSYSFDHFFFPFNCQIKVAITEFNGQPE